MTLDLGSVFGVFGCLGCRSCSGGGIRLRLEHSIGGVKSRFVGHGGLGSSLLMAHGSVLIDAVPGLHDKFD